MLQIKEWRISTWIIGAVLPFVRSMPSVVSLACPHCGSVFGVRRMDGTSSFIFEINSIAPSLSRFKHVAVLTFDGKLSISCVQSQFEKPQSPIASGSNAGTSYLKGNSARSCGCDPGASWTCDAFPRCEFGEEFRKAEV